MKCNFCSKDRSEVVVLVANKETDAKICDECIMLSLELLYKDLIFMRQNKIKSKAAKEKTVQLKNDLMVSLCAYYDFLIGIKAEGIE